MTSRTTTNLMLAVTDTVLKQRIPRSGTTRRALRNGHDIQEREKEDKPSVLRLVGFGSQPNDLQSEIMRMKRL